MLQCVAVCYRVCCSVRIRWKGYEDPWMQVYARAINVAVYVVMWCSVCCSVCYRFNNVAVYVAVWCSV